MTQDGARIGKTARALLVAGFLVATVSCFLARLAPGQQVQFEDKNLEAVVREACRKPEGDIEQPELANLTALVATYKGIANLSGLEHCTGLVSLNLVGNNIAELGPSAGSQTWLGSTSIKTRYATLRL